MEKQKIVKVRTRQVAGGRWLVLGAACRCGGDLFIDRIGKGSFRYETFCEACLACDPNGHPTRRECLANLDYFGKE